MIKNIKNVVIFRTDRIGEVLLSTVAADAITERYPDVNISFVTSEYSKPLLEGRGNIKKIITVDTFKKNKWFFKALDLAATLKKGSFDAAIVLNPHKTLHLACFLAGIPVRVGYDRKWGFLLNRKISDERGKGQKHEIEYTMDLLRLVGVENKVPTPRLAVAREYEDAVERLISERGISPASPLIAVHPGSSNPAKIWPCERYAELIRKLKKESDCNVALLGSEEERDLTGKILQKAGIDALDLAGALNLKELAALIKRSALFIGNDTGPMHMAAALGVPVIAIFGRNTPGVSPTRWRPWGEKHVVFHEDPGCDPCHDTACPYDYRCLRAVTVEEVFNAAKKMLET
jgi:lipopolysaccharide heptosyltransferase II